jgi:hypothetical protein
MSNGQIIVIDDYHKVSNLYVSTLEVYLNSRVIKFPDYKSAKEHIYNTKDEVDIIIVRSNIEDMNIGKLVLYDIRKNCLASKLYILGNTDISVHHAKIFKKDFEISSLIKSIAKDLDVTPHLMASLEVSEFYQFELKNIICNLVLVSDLYIKDGEVYNLILSKESCLNKDVIKILDNQFIQEVYVKSNDRLKFINSQLIFFQELLSDDEISLKDEVFIANQTYKLIRRSVLDMNVSTGVILSTERCINTIQSILKKISTLNKLIETLEKYDDINFKQTVMLCFFCNHLVDEIEWGTNEQKIKLTFVSFFHNITLSPEHVFINSNDKLQSLNLSKSQRKEVLNHALESARLVGDFKKIIPLGVDTVLKQHHGSLNGIGFNSFPQSISPLALIFLVADEWVTNVLLAQKKDITLSKEYLMDIVKSKYKTLSFEKVIAAFEKIDIIPEGK